MPSVRVRFEGAEKTLNVPSPNTPCGEVLQQAKLLFSLDDSSRRFELRYKKLGKVDVSLPFRLSGIMTNSTVDLVQLSALSSSSKQLVSVTLETISQSRVSLPPCPSSTSLAVLLAGQGEVESVRYIHRVIQRDELASLTLEALGLTSGTALFRVVGGGMAPMVEDEPQVLGVAGEKKAEDLTPTPTPAPPTDTQFFAAILVVMTVVKNLVMKPGEREKVGKMRLAKFGEKTHNHPWALDFLTRELQFEPTPQGELVLRGEVDIAALRVQFEKLASKARNVGGPDAVLPPGLPEEEEEEPFNPFRTSVSSTNGDRPRVGHTALNSVEDQVKAIRARREDLLQRDAGPLEDRQVSAFASSGELRAKTTENSVTDASDDKVLSRHLKETSERSQKASQFQTRAMRDLADLSRTPVFTRTLIRVVLPDRTVLQALFGTTEPVGAVLDVVRQHCEGGVDASTLSMATGVPPRPVIDTQVTFLSLGLFPAAFVHLSCQAEGALVRIRTEVFSNTSASVVTVPKGEWLAPQSQKQPLGKPKWLKLNKG